MKVDRVNVNEDANLGQHAAMDEQQTPHESMQLRRDRLLPALRHVCRVYADFFNTGDAQADDDDCLNRYLLMQRQASRWGLITRGGTSEAAYLHHWCLAQVLLPQVYVKSGVSTGAALHAFISTPCLETICAINPDLAHLRLPARLLARCKLTGQFDFSQIQFELGDKRALVHFADQSDPASRILQAAQQGFGYVLIEQKCQQAQKSQQQPVSQPTIDMLLLASFPNVSASCREAQGANSPHAVSMSPACTSDSLALVTAAREKIKRVLAAPNFTGLETGSAPDSCSSWGRYLFELRV